MKIVQRVVHNLVSPWHPISETWAYDDVIRDMCRIMVQLSITYRLQQVVGDSFGLE